MSVGNSAFRHLGVVMNRNQEIINGILAYICTGDEIESDVEKYLKDNNFVDRNWEEFSYWLSQFDAEKNVS